MSYLFEETNYLNSPIECFHFIPSKEQFPVRPHWHYFMEIILMTEGCAEMYVNDNRYVLHKGDMILFHPKAVHSIYTLNNAPMQYDVLKFDINRLYMTSRYAPKLRSIFYSAEKKDMPIFFPAKIAKTLNTTAIFSKCVSEMYTQKYGFEQIVQTHIYELLIKILRYWLDQGFTVDNDAFAQDLNYNIYTITEYIDQHISEGIKVEEIAKQCNMSYSYFAKKFLSIYGKTCKEYIEEMRLFKVEEFLIFTNFDMNYISQESGFSDCSHMIKSFKKYRGITPKQFRLKRRLS